MDNLAADFEINPNNPLNAEYELSEGVGFDCSFELFAAGTVWGSIDGNINNQTDLINLLNTKVDLTSFEELSQTVTNNYNELSGNITNLTTIVTDNYNTLSGQISDLTTTVNDNYTSLGNRLTTAEGSILNLTDTVNDNYTELNGKIITTNNNLSTLNKTVEDNNTAINNRVDGIVESFDGDISDLNNAVDNLSDTVTNNYTDLNGRITVNTDNIATIQNTINSYGDIVSYNAAYFATANQGALADTSLQPNDNITLLNNNAGYITSADIPTLEDITTTAQLNAINSGATTTNIGQITINQNNIADINDLIPTQATTSNQLADKNFVNSSIATNTANFIGTFNSVAELEAYSGTLTNNDYAFVATTDSVGNTLYDRYKYNANTQQWIYEYELNNSSFTAQQWASINSGITSGDVTLIGTALQPNDNISELTNDVGYITSASLPTVNNGTLDIQVNGTSVGTFTANQSGNTTANIVVPDSATWGNITGTLSNQTDLQNALNSKYDASNPDGYITSSDLPINYVTTDTAQNISGRKTFLGEKAIYFKQTTTTDKLGFTLYNPSNTELGALEYRPNTINGNALLALNCSQSGSNYVGFRYWSGINIVAPRPTTNGNYFIPVNVTDGTNTVTANNNGTLNISTLLPDVSNYVTNSSLAITLDDYALTTDIPTKTSDLTNDSNFATVSQIPTNNNQLTNGAGYITGITSSDITTALGYTPYDASNPNGYITANALNGYATEQWVTNQIPTVNNGTLTIQKNGTTIGTFTANQSGNSTINIEADTVLTDDITVSKNSDDELQAIGVIDDNGGNAIKTWTGTLAEYNAITTKDPNTIYNITDDNTADAYEAYTKSEINTLIQDALYYKSGDTFENISYCEYPAIVTSSGTSVRIGITTPKRLDNITSVTCNTLIVNFRKSAGGYAPSIDWDAKANATSITCTIGASNLMYVWVNYDNYGFTNNTPVGCELKNFSFTFT